MDVIVYATAVVPRSVKIGVVITLLSTRCGHSFQITSLSLSSSGGVAPVQSTIHSHVKVSSLILDTIITKYLIGLADTKRNDE